MIYGNRRQTKGKRNFQKGFLKSQSIVEYTLLVSLAIGSLIAMQIYFCRSLEGNYKNSTDKLGEQFSPHYSRYTLVRETQPYSAQVTNSSSGGYRHTLSTIQVRKVNPTEDDFSDKPLVEDTLFGN